jgi:hypothetical protein
VGGQQGARVQGVGSRSRRREGKDAAALGIGCAGKVSDVAAHLWPAELLMLWFWRQKGPFLLGASPGNTVCAAALLPGRPGGAAVPSGTREGAAGRAHASAERDKGEGKEDMGG